MPGFGPRQILCAVDLGPASRRVLKWAREFARAFHADVDSVHADWSEPPRYFMATQIKALTAEERKRRAKLRAEKADRACLVSHSLLSELQFEPTIQVVAAAASGR